MMDRLEGSAWRDQDGTHIHLAGLLPKFRGKAAIVDVYPFGEIKYDNDPGCAEVFIDEWTTGGGPERGDNLPWQDCVLIATQDYERVKIYIEGEEVLEMRVKVSCENGAQILRWGSLKQVEVREAAAGIV